mmetsp:Transcript_3122/g.6064  ORF Transcript_3122/g.6064 Transcript_3122/m.6064 type:complete len:86 (-) Transcript_3122:676-933(-)
MLSIAPPPPPPPPAADAAAAAASAPAGLGREEEEGFGIECMEPLLTPADKLDDEDFIDFSLNCSMDCRNGSSNAGSELPCESMVE